MSDEIKDGKGNPVEKQEAPKTPENTLGGNVATSPEPDSLSSREKFYSSLENSQKLDELNESIRESVKETAPVKEVAPKEDKKAEAEPAQKPETDDIDRLKQRVEKRIGREVAKRKSLEDELTETRQRLAELETQVQRTVIGNTEDRVQQTKEVKTEKDEDREPTDQEIATALQKARVEGNVVFELEILKYLMDRTKKQAIQEQEALVKEQQKKQAEVNAKFTQLVMDYTVFDDAGEIVADSPLNLNNKESLLYKTAVQLYKDPELNRQFYTGDQVEGFRRAVGDAYRELVELGYERMPKKAEKPQSESRAKKQLASPDAEAPDEPAQVRSSTPQDEIALEMKRRNQFHGERAAFRG